MTTHPFDLSTTVEELAYSFDGVFTLAEILDAVTRSQQACEPQATVHKFLVQNAGSSQITTALAEHLAPGKVPVRSPGSAPTGDLNALAVEDLAGRGIQLTDGKTIDQVCDTRDDIQARMTTLLRDLNL